MLRLSIIGSTGSIGESALKVVDRYPGRLNVVGLATGHNLARLVEQKQRYNPEVTAIAKSSESPLQDIAIGASALEAVAAWKNADVTVIASVGFTGVRPTLAAISAGKRVALANKETLVAAGAVVIPAAQEAGCSIAPIDSEHSAVWQCLRAGGRGEIRRLILTASGGPFHTRPAETFDCITPAEALAHPTWKMGPRITIDSATMMNKGFEIIEAAWLFDISPDKVDVVIHPQSIIHSMVEFQDGSVISQMGIPDMTLPITYALFAPDRPSVPSDVPTYHPAQHPQLEFFEPDSGRFPALGVARHAFRMGATGGAVLNAADEVAVAAFLEERLPFPRIISLVEQVLGKHKVISLPSLSDIEEVDCWARTTASDMIGPHASRVITT